MPRMAAAAAAGFRRVLAFPPPRAGFSRGAPGPPPGRSRVESASFKLMPRCAAAAWVLARAAHVAVGCPVGSAQAESAKQLVTLIARLMWPLRWYDHGEHLAGVVLTPALYWGFCRSLCAWDGLKAVCCGTLLQGCCCPWRRHWPQRAPPAAVDRPFDASTGSAGDCSDSWPALWAPRAALAEAGPAVIPAALLRMRRFLLALAEPRAEQASPIVWCVEP